MKINIWKYIVLFQAGTKAFKLVKAYLKARKLNKKKINKILIATYDDL